ncbi:uncharacterized protein BDZ99DRAFT_462360 [Mytilinidion resinicola]|uniref:Uncharacterized protein n=1 Tax=Mytilinidion resinicola TaxID=574789 RepID=A0A6A6YSR2_9PEZI|nr:uncharacterized protein BDZ99DRAFT_462360 [Mytilinidion resinicola]KAF2811084.1 hypothetical protein BDZ99DRAFT_462360 [Mytilinidion resinicola]
MPKYPGLGLPLRHNEQQDYGFYPIGAHGSCYGSDSDILPVRELAMMSIMERLTDKEDWHKKVFDEEIVSKYREVALSIPDEAFWKLAFQEKSQYWEENGNLHVQDDWSIGHVTRLEGIMTENTFDCCIKEVQCKAKYYEKSGIIPTLDACGAVAKSDKLVTPELHEALRDAFAKLQADHAASPDWHPRSNEMVQDLVHPSMYPLVYGRSKVLKKELVGVSNAIEKWAGKGEAIPKDDWKREEQDRFRYGVGSGNVPPEYWSDTYQWLPSNVTFQEDGTVKLTSYINNLHPTRYADIYRTVEKLIESALPAWDQCLALAAGYNEIDGPGRCKSRFEQPDQPDDENAENWIPSNPQEVADVVVKWNEIESRHEYDPEYDDETECKWKLLRKPLIPEPSFKEVDYTPEPEQRLVNNFGKSGLQVIVKIASIELTSEKPEFPTGGWHIEGQMNEHICATALYYLDSSNVTSSHLSFRMQTSAYLNDEINVGQDAYHWLEQVYGTGLGGNSSPCLQNYGSVETPQGRLLAFPNVFQHRVSSFKLIDPTKPGHRRFIALWLVDPTRRIISTANVPPQQDWWVDSTFGDTSESRSAALAKLPAELLTLLKEKGLQDIASTDGGQLPAELMEMVREYFNADQDAFLMGVEEAREHREKLMQVRGAFLQVAEKGWQQHSYSFCEH